MAAQDFDAYEHDFRFNGDTAERDAYFAPGNDEIWGEDNWVKCTGALIRKVSLLIITISFMR